MVNQLKMRGSRVVCERELSYQRSAMLLQYLHKSRKVEPKDTVSANAHRSMWLTLGLWQIRLHHFFHLIRDVIKCRIEAILS